MEENAADKSRSKVKRATELQPERRTDRLEVVPQKAMQRISGIPETRNAPSARHEFRAVERDTANVAAGLARLPTRPVRTVFRQQDTMMGR